MTLVEEDGTGLADANSYTNLSAANDYHAANLYNEEWTAADDPKREIALVMATRTIDTNMQFGGYKSTTEQALQWPRLGVVNKDAGPDDVVWAPLTARLDVGNFFPGDSLPKLLKDATAHLALDLLRIDRTLDDDAKGIRSLSIGQGAVSIDFDKGSSSVPLSDEVQRMLTKLGATRYGRGGRKKVTRVL